MEYQASLLEDRVSHSPPLGLHVETKPYFLTNVLDVAGSRAEMRWAAPLSHKKPVPK